MGLWMARIFCVGTTGDDKSALMYLASITWKGTNTLVVCPKLSWEWSGMSNWKFYLTCLLNSRSWACRTNVPQHKPSMWKHLWRLDLLAVTYGPRQQRECIKFSYSVPRWPLTARMDCICWTHSYTRARWTNWHNHQFNWLQVALGIASDFK